jgi:hypothetical protein
MNRLTLSAAVRLASSRCTCRDAGGAQVRVGVGEQGDSKHMKPQVRESSSQLWWGEVPWQPAALSDPACLDISATSVDKPGTLWVRRLQ